MFFIIVHKLIFSSYKECLFDVHKYNFHIKKDYFHYVQKILLSLIQKYYFQYIKTYFKFCTKEKPSLYKKN